MATLATNSPALAQYRSLQKKQRLSDFGGPEFTAEDQQKLDQLQQMEALTQLMCTVKQSNGKSYSTTYLNQSLNTMQKIKDRLLESLNTLQQQLNFSFQQDLKNEQDAFNYFLA